MNCPRLTALLALAAIAVPAAAGAQTPVDSFERLQHVLKVGQSVVVTDSTGHRTKGTVQDLSATSLAILAPGARTFAPSSVLMIRRADTRHKWTLIGLGAGAAIGTVGVVSTLQRNSDAVYFWVYIGVWLSPAAGATAGAIADHQIGSRPIFLAPSGAGAGKVSVSPLFAKRAAGLSVSFRF